MIKKYKKRPVVIEAFLINDVNKRSVAKWCGGQLQGGGDCPYFIAIPTLEGVMQAQVGDYVIKGVAGEFYPCKPDIFEKTYEPSSTTTTVLGKLR